MKKKANITLIFAVVLLCLIAAVIIVGVCQPESVETIQGEAEMTDYRVSSKVPGRIREIRVEEGDFVHKGDTLVILEAPDVMAKYGQANAALEAARAVEDKATGSARSEQVQAAYEMWQKALAGLDVAQKTYARVEALYKDSVVSAQKHDEALAQLNAYKATERAAKSQYDMAVHGAQAEDRAAARAQVERARGAVSEVSSYIDEMTLVALADGQVTDIFPELGELVGTGAPLLNVAMTDKVWFVFNVREDLLPGLSVGTETQIYIPALDKSIGVRVTKMKDVGTYAIWKATKALGQYDLKTFEVKAVPVNMADVEGVREGMSAIINKGK
ncbi:MAG: efflux RND transporter periplasmic adaptor subunit [Bacteroidales bacterium]|nr:efflux RND transporter periplasmic adaptor subunit [Bacteroidales bacterium]MDD7725282.1 efflux RND transporter periplasmic adaptor subunit [Bacteroidales bacterium]MDY4173763.1 efflux RND transporter periplasmic adaptor subunit [Bacteroidales bacterium]